MSPRSFVKNLTFQSNDLGQAQTILVYFPPPDFVNKGDIMPTPVLYLSDIGSLRSLRVYITSDYEETDIVRNQVDTPAMWTQDLTNACPEHDLEPPARPETLNTCFSRARAVNGNTISAETSVNIINTMMQSGEKTLTEANDVYRFSVSLASAYFISTTDEYLV
ncbi:uncharacterized protein F5147DRAFT_660144 [Suillus discolor]|uniref:Uncharacterized protein n=1 Tax=Suillus discolor TaxID=1912936 RepID=A0A9P7JLE2_9AGAM|nr:uncharacterized protein F5147DRAFT_660144 [Suillus discolor]KAG2083571.1 hypothetical protein F5147DRAFT_660144 [Suillus discolor]